MRELAAALSGPLAELGFSPACDPFRGQRSDASCTFNRAGRLFANEIISCLVRFEPTELIVHFIGSEYSPVDLQGRDVFADSVIANLFDFQFYKLGIPQSQLLPKVITVGDYSAVASQLLVELVRTDSVVWADLLRRTRGA
jgi:hypothetical protein